MLNYVAECIAAGVTGQVEAPAMRPSSASCRGFERAAG
jgi:hypothetical protein